MLEPNVLRYGSPRPLPEQRLLRAGPLTLAYEAGDLRYIRFGSHEVLRRVYVAVRDHNWDTISPQMSNENVEVGVDSFRITFDVAHRQHEIDFHWRGEITGSPDGTIRFVMDGVAQSSFRSNRTGFCVLHPLSSAGAAARVEHTDGSVEETIFPQLIAPQLVENGQIHPVSPFAEMQALAHEIEPGVWAEVRFEGDVFELEDQRNWIDGSYKTYCRPLRLPFPYEIPAGTKVHQSVTLHLHRQPKAANNQAPTSSNAVSFIVHPSSFVASLPAIGLGSASHNRQLELREIEILRALHIAHVRIDIKLQGEEFKAQLRQASEEAQAIGVPLEIALFLSNDADAELTKFRTVLDEIKPIVARWLVFHIDEKSTSAVWLRHARAQLGTFAPEAPFASGTNVYFTELNRGRPDTNVLDLITYSVNPQVHAFDNASLVETAAAIAATVESARAWSSGKPIIVSPVTLKPRFNPVATGPQPEPAPGELPPEVDSRQMSLLGACWTLTSLKYLAESGAASTTYYETTGWRGVMETKAGSAVPERFPSLPGAVFPLYHVLADVGEFAGSSVVRTQSSDTLVVDGIAFRRGDAIRVLLANVTNQPQQVRIEGLPAGVLVRGLDERNVIQAMEQPDVFRAESGQEHTIHDGILELTLAPYAVARIDGDLADEA